MQRVDRVFVRSAYVDAAVILCAFSGDQIEDGSAVRDDANVFPAVGANAESIVRRFRFSDELGRGARVGEPLL